jgi:two-component system response regulator FixJ
MAKSHIYVADADRDSRVSLMRWAAERGSPGRPFLSGADFIAELPHLECGIVFIDVQNSGGNGFEVIEAVVQSSRTCVVIGMAHAADTIVAVAALKRGAVDFLVKPIALTALHEAVANAERIMEQRRHITEQTQRDGDALGRLTGRERQVLACLATGMTSKAIAEEIGISARTVEGHRAALMDKLDAETTAAAIATSVRYETVLLANASRDPGPPRA